jgi:DNA repair exonuclease SbcCD ATPase subunit
MATRVNPKLAVLDTLKRHNVWDRDFNKMKEKYRSAALFTHLDKAKANGRPPKESTEAMKELNAAYDMVKTSKELHDTFLELDLKLERDIQGRQARMMNWRREMAEKQEKVQREFEEKQRRFREQLRKSQRESEERQRRFIEQLRKSQRELEEAHREFKEQLRKRAKMCKEQREKQRDLKERLRMQREMEEQLKKQQERTQLEKQRKEEQFRSRFSWLSAIFVLSSLTALSAFVVQRSQQSALSGHS